jgi:DNA-directed RNA polymerase specialized sigma24 family protein
VDVTNLIGDRPMTGADDLRELPEAYGMALRLEAEGLDAAAIGRVLDIETESVPPLLDLARAKLESVRNATSAGAPASGDGDPPACTA